MGREAEAPFGFPLPALAIAQAAYLEQVASNRVLEVTPIDL